MSAALQPSARRRLAVVPGSQPWKHANPLRGRNFADLACAFLERFPLGTKMRTLDIDTWCYAMEIYPAPGSTEKQSDSWRAHIQRRNEFLHGLNKAAAHPRMRDNGMEAYYIQRRKGGWCEVQTPAEQLAEIDLTSKVCTLLATKKRDLLYKLQAPDWQSLPPWERLRAEELYFNMGELQQSIEQNVGRMIERQERLLSSIEAALGQTQPRQLPIGLYSQNPGNEAQDTRDA